MADMQRGVCVPVGGVNSRHITRRTCRARDGGVLPLCRRAIPEVGRRTNWHGTAKLEVGNKVPCVVWRENISYCSIKKDNVQ